MSSARKRPTKKARVSDDSDKVIEQALQQLNALPSTHDCEDDFGNVVANGLRQMHGDNKIYAEKLIYDVLCMYVCMLCYVMYVWVNSVN